MTKITIERETLLPCPFCGDDGDKGRQEVTQMIEGRNKFARITCRACGAMCPEENWNRRAALAAQPAEPSMRPLPDHDNHHNALKCPYCNPRGLKFAEPAAAQPADIVNPISQQEPVAYRHSKTGQLYDSEEEVPLADGDEWAEPLYATPATQQAPAAWRQWSTKLHDWDYQTNRGDLRPDTPADPLFVAAAQLVPLTDEQRNDRIEAWSSQGWGDRLGEVVRICIAIERAVLEAQPADAQQEPVAWRVRAKTLEQLLTRAIDHVSYGSRRSYDGVGGYKMREAASHLLSEIVVALAAPPTPAAVPPEGGIVVSKNEAGQIVCVSRQDEDGQFLSIIAESADAVPPGMALVPIEPTPGIITTGTVALMKASDSDLDATREEIAATYRAMIAAAGDKP